MALFEADQADRHAGSLDLVTRDRERRQRLDELFAEGAVRTAEDHFHAAMLLQHGGALDDYRRAHELASRAAELGHGMSARWLAAAALDRWLMHQGKPQKYGTQYRPEGGRFRLWEVDPATTDEERAEWGVPPLAEALRRAEEMDNLVPRLRPEVEIAVSLELPGLRVELGRLPPEQAEAWQEETVAAKADFYARLSPFQEGDPRPGYLPAGLSPRRTPAPETFCAADAPGRPALIWSVLPTHDEVYVLTIPMETPEAVRLEAVDVPGWAAISMEGHPDGPALALRRGDSVWVLGGEVGRDELLRVAASLPVDPEG